MSKIIIVGDLFPVPSNFDLFSKGDIQTLFGQKICDLFASADYRICNLEGALTDRNGYCEKTGPVVKAPSSTVFAIKELGIDCCTLANNHITDAGHEGVCDTLCILDNMGISHIGAGVSVDSINTHIFFEVCGRKVGLYNVAETMYNAPGKNLGGAYLYDEYVVCKELESIKKECDYLIVVYHGGAEKFRYPSPQTKKRFHRMADSGADMILSQHTHCIGSEEYYNGAYLLYGQGNFLFRSFNNEYTDTGLIVEVDFESGQSVVKKHLVKSVVDKVRYGENQDFVEFNKRSSQVHDDAFVQDKFIQYCYKELPVYLNGFKGRKTFFGKIISRYFPEIYKNWLMNKAYERKQLLLSLHSLRSEQNREIVIEGIIELLKQTECHKRWS